MSQRSSSPAKARVDAAGLLIAASRHVRPAPDRKPWYYGWSSEEYRHSGNAAIADPTGVMAIEVDGIGPYEQAVTGLLKSPAVRARWDSEEFWGLIAESVAFIARSSNSGKAASSVIERVMKAPPSLVAFPVSNVVWQGPPASFSFAVIGDLDDAFVSQVNSIAGRRMKMEEPAVGRWIAQQPTYGSESQDISTANPEIVSPREQEEDSHRHSSSISDPPTCGSRPGIGTRVLLPVVWATWVSGQLNRAFEQAERQFENLVGVALLLERDLDKHKIWMLRGSINRPGPRGITLDRGTVESLLGESGQMELVTTFLTVSDLVKGSNHRWYSADPIPLADLLGQPSLRTAIEKCLGEDNPVTDRIKVAARWYSEALWATQNDDAALALGVALDSIVGSRSALPAREMKERFAFLEPDKLRRAERSTRYQEIFSVRSSVAHGGSSSRLEASGYIKGVAADVTWAAHRLLKLYEEFKPGTEKALEEVFDGLRWGTLEWPAGE